MNILLVLQTKEPGHPVMGVAEVLAVSSPSPAIKPGGAIANAQVQVAARLTVGVEVCGGVPCGAHPSRLV